MPVKKGLTKEPSRTRHASLPIRRLLAGMSLPLALVLVVALALWATPAVLASVPSDVQDVYQAPSLGNDGFIWSAQSITQLFTAGKDGQLDRVSLYLTKHGPGIGSNPITVQIFAVQGGKATGTALANASIPASDVYNDDPGTTGNPSVSWVDTYFASYLPIQAGTQYALVLSSSVPDMETCDGGAQCSYYLWVGVGFKTFVIPGAATTTVLSSANPTSISYGTSSVDLAAMISVAPGDAEGAIAFAVTSTDGQTTYCSTAPVTVDTTGSATGTCDFTTQPAAGTYSITATYSDPATETYASSTTTGTLTITLPQPNLTFDLSSVTGKAYGDPSFSIASYTKSNSTGAITFAVDATSSGCMVTADGSALTITGAGTCVIDASQAASASYAAAGPIKSSFTIAKATPKITWSPPAPIIYGTALSGSQLDPQAVEIDGSTPLAGTFSYQGSTGYGSPFGVADGTIMTAGSYGLYASFTPTDTNDYNVVSADPTSGSGPHVSLTVNKATPVIAWSTPTAITYGTPLSTTQLNAYAAGVFGTTIPGIMYFDPAAGTILSAGSHKLSVSFSPDDSNNYTTASKTVTLQINPATIGVMTSNEVVATGASSVQLQATINSQIPNLSGLITFTVSNSQGQTVGSASAPVSSANPVALATFDIPAGTPTGSYTVTADYRDSSNGSATGLGTFQLTITNDIAPVSGQAGQPIVAEHGFWALVELQITDAQGNNLSSRDLTVTAQNLAPAGQSWDGKDANFVHAFQYGPAFGGHGHGHGHDRPDAGYRLTINTRNLAPGDYTLSFTVEGDPVIHTATIEVKG